MTLPDNLERAAPRLRWQIAAATFTRLVMNTASSLGKVRRFSAS